MRDLIRNVLKLELYMQHLMAVTGTDEGKLSDIISELIGDIMTLMGLPKDNTSEVEIDSELRFCRDYYDELIFDYILSKEFAELKEITDKEVDEFMKLIQDSVKKYKQE